jgi:hypothetical protein
MRNTAEVEIVLLHAHAAQNQQVRYWAQTCRSLQAVWKSAFGIQGYSSPHLFEVGRREAVTGVRITGLESRKPCMGRGARV